MLVGTFHVYVCVCVRACMGVCACVCVCVHVCVHRTSPYTLTPSPTPQTGGPKAVKNAITHIRIQIIRFCLKIYDLWAILHSYRLG